MSQVLRKADPAGENETNTPSGKSLRWKRKEGKSVNTLQPVS